MGAARSGGVNHRRRCTSTRIISAHAGKEERIRRMWMVFDAGIFWAHRLRRPGSRSRSPLAQVRKEVAPFWKLLSIGYEQTRGLRPSGFDPLRWVLEIKVCEYSPAVMLTVSIGVQSGPAIRRATAPTAPGLALRPHNLGSGGQLFDADPGHGFGPV
jgi:hypothetical protein